MCSHSNQAPSKRRLSNIQMAFKEINNEDNTAMLAFMISGSSWVLFIQGIIQCGMVFKRKKSTIYILSIIGLVSAIAELTIVLSFLYFNLDEHIYVVLVTPLWIIMIQAATWVYCIRIKSLGGITKYDYIISKTPWVILMAQLPTIIIFNLKLYYKQLQVVNYISGICLSVIITVCEIIQFVGLLSKVLEMLEYRTFIKKLLRIEISLALVMMILFDISLLVFKIVKTPLDVVIRPFSYILRIVLVIRFFDDLLDQVNESYLSSITSKRDLKTNK